MTPTILTATWRDGLFVQKGDRRTHELAGHSIGALANGGNGSALAIVDRHSLRRRDTDGTWRTLLGSRFDLSCGVVVGDVIYAGTDDARVLRVGPRRECAPLAGFAEVPGRDTWYAGQALVDGEMRGPPLGVRSIAATPDGAVILANVHVGGIPRSTDRGRTWHPTIDVDADVHEVRVHPTRPHIAVAAAAAGLCISDDGGVTWTIERDGLHASYCSAVAFLGDDVLVAASADHFAPRGAVYRRSLTDPGAVRVAGGGLPEWLDGIADTRCIATRGATAAIADRSGALYVSTDDGRTWARRADGLPAPSSVLVVS